jgi:arylsulfatase A-like enzyme
MTGGKQPSRREFLERLGAGAVLGAAHASRRTARPPVKPRAGAAWTPPPVLKNPNILVIMVDQLRLPMWMTSAQSDSLSTVLPNIVGNLANHSYYFGQFFVNATNCTPSRACIMTGLYPPQTGMYDTETSSSSTTLGPSLNPAFATWAAALGELNPAYKGNIWWFGKWHLSNDLMDSPLAAYGLNTRTYPGGMEPYNPSPNGAANEGTDGGYFDGLSQTFANDAMITGDFIGWLTGQDPTPSAPATPWCATVSLINPHDISSAPAWLAPGPFPPPNVPLPLVYYPPPPGSPPSFYNSLPAPWNYEDLQQVTNKPSWQYGYQDHLNAQLGPVDDWVLFLNQYMWLQSFVDQQVGLILNALYSSPYASNTVVVFFSDHGEYGGSHGLHGKGNAAYDEALRVPLYVQFPGQTGTIPMNQMCSAVDLFGLICDLGTGGSGQWRLAYPDLASRQSLWSFLYNNSSETRIVPGAVGLPFIFHTYDQAAAYSGMSNSNPPKLHIVCLRTKLDLDAGAIGAKLAFYYAWDPCTTYPNATPPDAEFYDYNPATSNNAAEKGNDYFSNDAVTQQTIQQYTQALGTYGPPSTGLIGNELNCPLVGTGTDGNPLTQAQQNAYQAFFDYTDGSGTCSADFRFPRGTRVKAKGGSIHER